MFVSEKQIEIRYAETDQMGVVYHANYLIWMEIESTVVGCCESALSQRTTERRPSNALLESV